MSRLVELERTGAGLILELLLESWPFLDEARINPIVAVVRKARQLPDRPSVSELAELITLCERAGIPGVFR